MSTPEITIYRVEQWLFTAVTRTAGDGVRGWTRPSRVFGVDELVPDLMELEPFQGTTIPAKADQVDAADRVRARMWTAWRNETARTMVERVLPMLHQIAAANPETFDGYAKKARFSPTAGCSCPCSPGLVLDARIRVHGLPVDLYVEEVDVDMEANLLRDDLQAAADHAIGSF